MEKGIFSPLGHALQQAYQSTVPVPTSLSGHLLQDAVVRPTQMSGDHQMFKYFGQQGQGNYATQQDAVSAAIFHQGQQLEHLQQQEQEPLVTVENQFVNDVPPSDLTGVRTNTQTVSTIPTTEVPDQTQTVRTLQSDFNPEISIDAWRSNLFVDR